MIQSDRYLTDKEKEHRAAVQEAERQLPMLDGDAAAEYNALKEQYPNTLIGFELGGYFLFYDKDAITVKEVFRSNLLSQENALGKVKVTGFLRREWVAKSQKLWAEGNSIYLAGQGGDGTHHQTKYLREEDYLPIGIIVKLDGRDFRVDHVNFMFKSVSLQDMDLTNSGQPIFRVERLPNIRELYEQQQDEIIDVSPEKAVDYKVGDEVVVDLPTRTIEGKIGYVGETDVRIDTSAHGQSWDNEVLNKQQFEDGLRRDEPTPDEELDKLPISVEVNGEWQTFPDAAAADEALNAEPMPEAAGNFHITDDNLGVGGPKQKFARNIEAIQTLRTLEQEHRGATAEEQQVLSQYVGWGGLADVFDPNKENWSAEYTQLKGLLTEEEYAAARASTLNAHYTSPVVIRAIYDAVEKMGFQSGNILEPSMGIGNFFGMLPSGMADSRLYGVELDSITGRIAQKLYPQADITVAGFETTDRRDFYDLAVGNVPFGQYKVNDKAYNKLGFSIHNYFFAKTIDQIRPGGVIAFVTSRFTMDSKDSSARKYMAERADLLGAIRLPNNAFRANAGTDVVSDIIFLQKRDRPIDHEPDWVQLGKTEDGFAINQYFVDHPEMVLGELTTESTQYGREELTVAPIEGAVLADQLAEAVQHIEGNYTAVEIAAPDVADVEAQRKTLPADPTVKNFSYTVVDGEIYYRENSIMTQVELSDNAKGRVTGMVELRQIINDLIQQQLEDYPDADIKATQERLNAAYDDFTAKYGLLNDRKNGRLFEQDSSYYLLCSLENLDEQGQLKSKAAMFTKRTIRPERTVTSVDTLNLRDSRVYDTIEENGKEKRVLNQNETTLAQQKQQAIKDAFAGWVWKDPQRRALLVKKYNELFNSTRPREYDGSHIHFVGMNPEINLREHQRNAVAHVLYGYNTLLAHEVGAGKSFEMAASAMELKRLGLCQKSLFVVPNHLTEQWASEFLRLYPHAKLLVTSKKDFEPGNRKKFCARIATGDYDAVIIGHSQFEKIPLSAERQERLIQEQMDEIEEAIEEAKAQVGEHFTVKQLEKLRKSLKQKLEKLQGADRKDDVVTFEQLGVDRLFVDESQAFKNLYLYTKMRNVAGLSTSEAQKSSDMFGKCRYLDEITGGRGVIFATGTPLSNSMTEMYTLMRYLQYNTLQQKGLTHFDAWASTFGETTTAIELAPEGYT
ncbi:DEAD/DEAH box helicase family protein [Faecalibacterium prausnitzii]